MSLPVIEGPQPIPRDKRGPVFNEPWEAQVFAMTLTLFAAGHFTWEEWTRYLSSEIKDAHHRSEPDLGDTYDQHWLRALERLITDKQLLSATELRQRKADWDEAACTTEHGQPIQLD